VEATRSASSVWTFFSSSSIRFNKASIVVVWSPARQFAEVIKIITATEVTTKRVKLADVALFFRDGAGSDPRRLLTL
jgi:hypothetical protein